MFFGVARRGTGFFGGFPRGAISELAGGRASGKTAVALSLLASLGREELFAWVDARGELYPPAAAARGVDLARLLIVRPGAAAGTTAALWAAEALLGSAAFAAVVVDVPLRKAERGWDVAAPVPDGEQKAAHRSPMLDAVQRWTSVSRSSTSTCSASRSLSPRCDLQLHHR